MLPEPALSSSGISSGPLAEAPEPCRHHVPTDGGAVRRLQLAHGELAALRDVGRGDEGAGARERHGGAAGHVLRTSGTEASLPGFCLERTCQAYRPLGTCLCFCRCIHDRGCTREKRRVEGGKLSQSGQSRKIKFEIKKV